MTFPEAVASGQNPVYFTPPLVFTDPGTYFNLHVRRLPLRWNVRSRRRRGNRRMELRFGKARKS